MNTLVMTAAGVVGLLVFALIAHVVNRQRSKDFIDGGRLFVWIWLLINVTDYVVGIVGSGISPLVELGCFAIAFGVPAALAFVVSGSLRRRRLRTES